MDSSSENQFSMTLRTVWSANTASVEVDFKSLGDITKKESLEGE